MKTIISILILASSSVLLHGQQPAPPANMQTAPTAPPGNPGPGNLPPGRAFNAINPPPGRPFMTTNRFNTAISNVPAAINPTSMGSTQAFNLSITNTLRTMAPEQANNVIQVQASLNALQTLAINIGVQNIEQVVQQNPQVQQQVQQISTRINSLARGSVRPSGGIVQRLSLDLFRAVAPVRLPADRQLVLAIVINETCNSGNMTAAQIDEAINTGLAALRTAGVPLAVAHPVTCDLHSIAYELQPNLGM